MPTLQRMAMRILSLTSSASACERNWSTFENIHTKKRNRLTTTHLDDLSFIQFNARMLSKKQMIKEKKIVDVLYSSETTEAQGFVFEGGDACAVVIYRDEDEEELDSPTRTPTEVDEQFKPRRSARLRYLYEDEEFDSEED